MGPREGSQDEETRELEELYEDMGPDDEPVGPDDDDTIGRPVQLRP